MNGLSDTIGLPEMYEPTLTEEQRRQAMLQQYNAGIKNDMPSKKEKGSDVILRKLAVVEKNIEELLAKIERNISHIVSNMETCCEANPPPQVHDGSVFNVEANGRINRIDGLIRDVNNVIDRIDI